MKPFLKWAGGKTQLLEHIVPKILAKRTGVDTYWEPFVGAGAVFLHLKANYPDLFKHWIISDINSDLMGFWQTLSFNPIQLNNKTKDLESEYNMLSSMEARKDFYLWIRRRFNTGLDNSAIDKMAQLLFLNKAGFNGLYRVNKSGAFNVPFGKKESISLWTHHTPYEYSDLLRGVRMCTGSYDTLIHWNDNRDNLEYLKNVLVYLDPPYIPLTATSSFTSYTSDGFGAGDQRALADTFKRGPQVVASNSDTPMSRSLWGHFSMQSIDARRAVSATNKGRGTVRELLIWS